jgi:hypothetical protein
MSLQIIEDSKGKATGVFIPIKDWKALKKQHKELELLENEEPNKTEILEGLKQAIHEVNLIKRGKLKGINAKDLLNEL